MSESGFVILKKIGNRPSMAMCDICRMKFFVPAGEFVNDPTGAEEYLRQKYVNHSCTV